MIFRSPHWFGLTMFDISKKFTACIEGRRNTNLAPSDHVASGGEGHIYRPGNGSIALKIWDDPARATSGRMTDKIKLLSALKSPEIVAPDAFVRDKAGNIIGYVMPWVTGWDLPLAFTNDWRGSHGFDDTAALAFVERMREVTLFVHSHDIIMGDANELNILGVNNEPRYIDVDPWLPPGYRGDKIMPTIQDWNAKSFTKEADWFAWGIITFQLLTGIHPYRGSHPDFKRSDFEGRMKANASVFDSKVKLNAAVRPLANIPSRLRDWYAAAFQKSERSVPPEVRAVSAPVRSVAAVAIVSGALKITEAFKVTTAFGRIVAPDVMMLTDGTLVSLPDGRPIGKSGMTAFVRAGSIIGVCVVDGIVSFSVVQPGTMARPTSSGIAADSVWSAANRLFAVVRDGIMELNPRDLGPKHTLLTGRKWSLNPNATFFGDGAALLDALGAKYLVVPQAGQAVAIVRTRELDGMKPVAIMARGKIVIASLIDRAGSYHRANITLSDDLLSCRCDLTPTDNGSLSDIILDNGIVLWIDANGDLGALIGGAPSTYPLGSLAGGRLIAGPSGVFCAVRVTVFRLSLS